MKPPEIGTSNQSAVRNGLRIAGPIVAILGLIFLIIGVASFFSSFGSFGPPRYFWCAFVGIPLLGVGLMLCQWGYMGAIFRYMAGESAPVSKDIVNYLGEHTKPGVKSFSKAVTEGILEAREEEKRRNEGGS